MTLKNYLTEEKGWIDAARDVVKKHQFVYIDPKTNQFSSEEKFKKKGVIVLDAVTANMLVQIADALNPSNRKKFTGMNILQAVDIGWKLVKKSQGK